MSRLFPESPLTFHRILKSVFIHQDADNLVRRICNDRAHLRAVLRDILQGKMKLIRVGETILEIFEVTGFNEILTVE